MTTTPDSAAVRAALAHGLTADDAVFLTATSAGDLDAQAATLAARVAANEPAEPAPLAVKPAPAPIAGHENPSAPAFSASALADRVYSAVGRNRP